ncbi:MAG: UDP-3-O-(3-hydroxymyristoyl)glucosamine N-acyltransferase [Bacteroidales bacterium]
MDFSASQIADFLQGTIEGDPSVTVSQIAKIEEGTPGSLTFLSNPAYIPYIYKTKASIVLVSESFQPEHPLECTLIRVADPYNALAQLLELYQSQFAPRQGISSLSSVADDTSLDKIAYLGEYACIGKGVTLGKNVRIYPHCYIGDHVTIGDDTTLYSGVKVYDHCVIGKDCTLHANVVIGADGFGFAPQSDSNYRKVAQIGNVVIEDQVEIGANTTIDRATLGSTIIGRGVKLDNLIQIAHNVTIGENTVMAAQSGVAGSTRIGRNCMIGGQVGISGHLVIGDEVKMAAQTGVSSHIKDGEIIMGSPSMPITKYRKSFIYFRNFEKLVQRLDQLEDEIRELKKG